jgi:EthD domain
MIKLMFGWKDNPRRSAQECEAHYRAHHLLLAREAFDGTEGFELLLFNRVLGHRVNDHNQPESHPAPADMDAFIELYFDTQDHLDAAMNQPVLARMFEDHPNFMATDTPANIRIYQLAEEVVLGRHPAM